MWNQKQLTTKQAAGTKHSAGSSLKPCALLQVDRNEDMIRSALRAVDSISRIPNVDACVPFKQLMQNVVLQEPMAKKFGMVRNERAEAEGAFSL